MDNRLSQLADTIAKNFDQELREIHQLTQRLGDAPIPVLVKNEEDHQQILAADTNHTLAIKLLDSLTPSTISIPKLLSDSSEFDNSFSSYPFLRFVFWLDNQGTQQFRYSMLDKEHLYNNHPPYDDRAYFKTIQEGGGYPLTNEDTLFFIQSLVSRTTGEPSSVFSRAARHNHLTFDHKGTPLDTSKNTSVLAISTVLYSVTEPCAATRV